MCVEAPPSRHQVRRGVVDAVQEAGEAADAATRADVPDAVSVDAGAVYAGFELVRHAHAVHVDEQAEDVVLGPVVEPVAGGEAVEGFVHVD